MSDYQFVSYETVDDGQIARVMLNRPEARNAQNRGLLVELERRDAASRGRRPGAGRDPGRHRVPMFSAGHDMGSKVSLEEDAGAERSTRPARSTAAPGREPSR